MVATFWLLGWALCPTQTLPPTAPVPPAARRFTTPASMAPVPSADWVLTPRLPRGQELVYRGTFTEETIGARVQFQRAYRFETRYFVLESSATGTDLAAFTSLQARAPASASANVRIETAASSVRLEKLRLDSHGKVSAGPLLLSVPLEGPCPLESGAFVEMPRGRVQINQVWEVHELGRPPMAWRLVGSEAISGQTCLKFVGVQQSDDWERPRADRSGWRRQDQVWMLPRTGMTVRVERVIEHHGPARREVSQRSLMSYELESSLHYPHQLALDRRQEVLQALSYREAARMLVAEPARNSRPLEALKTRIAFHLENQPPTPYRDAVLQVKRQVDAACRGEVVPVAHQTLTPPAPPPPLLPTTVVVGEAAPDFVATEFGGKGTARLQRWKGRPILMVFYTPTSVTAVDVLRFAREVQTAHGDQAAVLGLSVSNDSKAVLDQAAELRLGYPLLFGGGLRISYGVETTPKFVVIDSAGIVRGMYLGWGAETAHEVMSEFRRWLPAAR